MGNGTQTQLRGHSARTGVWRALAVICGLWIGTAEAQTAAQDLPACRDDQLLVTGDFGSVRFTVEVAATPEEKAQGLMFREAMASSAGMIFLYDRMGMLSFWMRNTLIPLDMIFIDDRGAVVHVHPDAIPLDETPISSQVPAQFVLEINGGLAARIGLTPGAVIRHPALPQDRALLPC